MQCMKSNPLINMQWIYLLSDIYFHSEPIGIPAGEGEQMCILRPLNRHEDEIIYVI